MFVLTLLVVAIRMTAPILLCATGALYNDRAGVTNITLEGSMLISAFFAAVGSYFTSSWVVGALCGVAASVATALIFFFITVVLHGDELVVGLSMNILLDGLTVFLLRQIFGKAGSIVSDRIQGIPAIHSETFSKIPVLGTVLDGHTWIVFFAFVGLYATYIILYRTPAGLKIRSCGEKPEAAATVGVNVVRVRFMCNIVFGVLCGLAGVQLSLGFLSLFTEGMTVGRGFIALAAVMFCRGKPIRLLIITLFFGLAQAVSNQMQLMQLPSELVLVIPYIAVIIFTLFTLEKRKKMPVGDKSGPA